MKKILNYIGEHLSARLSMWIVFFAGLIFAAALGFLFARSRKAIRQEAIVSATRVLDNTVLRVNGILEDVELAAANTEWQVYQNLDNPDKMGEISRHMVRNNSVVRGGTISFEPDYYPSKGRYYSVYTHPVGDHMETIQWGNDENQYFYLDWYLLPRLLLQPCWTEPYTEADENSPEEETEAMMTYCVPLTGNDGNFIGTLTLDVSLRWLSETISAIKPYPHSYSILIGRSGTYLVHPDPNKLFYESVFTEHILEPDNPKNQLGHAMLDWESGMRQLEINGEMCYVFFQPLMTTGWSLAIVFPEDDIFASYKRLTSMVLIIVVIGLLLMLYFVGRIIRRELRPLQQLSEQAGNIAEGNFYAPLPALVHEDEIGKLSRSFGHMQHSLVRYIQELTETTANKERIEGELRIAREIQMDMLPRVFPPFPERADIDLYACMNPAKEVGGDLYDFFLQNEKLYFCVADVSGKGVPASLLMAVTRNLFREVARQELPPERIARQINDTLSEDNEQMMFVTFFVGVLDLQKGCLDFCNCGHNPPVLLTPEPHFMECKSNTPLGVCVGWEFEGQHVDNFWNSPLLVYTDGLNEAENPEHQEFGNDRLLSVLTQQPFAGSQETLNRVLSAVEAHVNGAQASDDLTLLCLNIVHGKH